MSVLKLSKKDIIRNEDKDKVKFKKSDLSFDSARISGWENTNRESLNILNDYSNRINKGEWLGEEDRKTYRKALDTYINTANRLRSLNKTFGEGYSDEDEQKWTDSITAMNKGYDDVSNYYSQFASDKEYNEWYENYKKSEEFRSVLGAEDFEHYKQIGKDIDNPTWDDASPKLNIFGWKPFGESAEVNNIVTFAEANKGKGMLASAKALQGGGSGNEYTEIVNLINTYMTDEEKSIYNYYVGKGDTEKANEYITQLKDVFNQRAAGEIAEQVDDTALELVFSTVAGLDQFASGVKNLDNFIMGTEGDTTSAIQYAQSGMSSNNKGIWKVSNDLLNTTGNMLPSILVSTIPVVGKPLGLATMGASVVGNSYAEMKNLGYSDWQARGYATLVGAAETGLQALLGGIGKLGGKYSLTAATTKLVSKFDNALAKLAIKVPLNMASEGLEESIQTVLEPAFKALLAGEDFEAPEWEEILYSGLLGALSAGVLEGAPTIAGTAYSNIQAKKIYGDGSALVDEALGVATEGSELKALADKYKGKIEGGKSLSGSQINHLNEAIASNDVTKIKSAAEARLTELGETGDVSAIADILVKQATGEKLTSKEVRILNDSKNGHLVSAELNKDNIKSGGLANNWAENIGTRRVSPETYNKPLYDLAKAVSGVRESAESDAVANTVAENQKAAEKELKVSESGKTTYTDAKGDTVDVAVKKVVSTNGGLKVELDNGETVSAKDLSFSTQEEALMYEIVARMEATPETANVILNAFKPKNAAQSLQYLAYVPMAYEYGKWGYEAGLKNVKLSETEKRMAYNRGRMDAITDTKNKPKAIQKNKTSETTKADNDGIVYEGDFTYDESTANELQKASMIGIRAIAKMSSLDVHIFESVVENGERVYYLNGERKTAPNGFFKDGNKIYIDINAGNGGEGAMLYTMSHEITHYIRRWNAKGFKELGDFLIAEYGKKGVPVNALLEAQKDKIRNRYKKENKTLPSEAKLADMAYEELVADAMSDMFADPKAYEKLAKLKQKNRTLWQKLGEAIKQLLDKLKTALGVYKSKDVAVAKEAYEVRGFSADVYNKLQDLYIKAFVEADANYEASNGGKQSVSEEAMHDTTAQKEQLSVREEFYKEFDAWDKKDTNKTFTIGTTSEALQSIGMKSQSIILRSGTVLQKVNKHPGISFDTFKGIPELLEHPIIVQFSDAIDPKTKKPKYDSRITVLGELYADGKPVLVSLELLPTNQKKTAVLDFSVVVSAYAKDALQRYLSENSILYIEPNKKRTNKWLSLNRLSLPLGEKQYGSIRSISYVDGKVKVQNKKNLTPTEIALHKAGVVDEFGNYINKSDSTAEEAKHSDRDSDGNELSVEQQEYFKDSKVRDKNGSLMVVYHGSPSEFTIFKQSKIGAHGNAHGRGFYFTEDEGLASSFYREGGQLLKGYLDIKNPMSEEKLTIKKSALAKLIKVLCEEEAKNLVEHDSYGSIREALPDTFISNYVYTYGMSIADAYREVTDMVYSSCDNDVDIIAELYNAGARGLALEKAYEVLGYDGAIYTHPDGVHEYVSFVSSQFKSITNKIPTFNPDIRYSDRDTTSYAPTFYSHMGNIIDGIRLEKMGANGVVPYLKGKGVKDEEIKWSGIEAFLEGKKSVTKAELQEFVAGSQLQIVEQMSGTATYVDEDGNTYTESEFKDKAYEMAKEQDIDRDRVKFVLDPDDGSYVAYAGSRFSGIILEAEADNSSGTLGRWSDYKLEGGSNYRELVFQMPNSWYSNNAMRAHWGEDAEGVLAHARIQDFNINGKKMLFIEELQSDWHNEGLQSGYIDSQSEAEIDKLKSVADEKFFAVEDYSTEMTGLAGEWETIEKTEKGAKLLSEYREARDTLDQAMNKWVKRIPDAPFRNTYHEYVLKRLLRMAAEEGYDSIGWTPSGIQSDRWSDEFVEAYRIEYDQDMPKFLRKYGKKWGATVGKAAIAKETVEGKERILKETELENVKRDIERAKQELARKYDSYEKAVIQRSIESMKKTVATLEQELSASLSVWSMDITDSMKDSVLYDGQTLYSDRDDLREAKSTLKTKYKVDPSGIESLAERYYNSYGGGMTKTEFTLRFVSIANKLAETFANKTHGDDATLNSALEEIFNLADEISNEPKDDGVLATELREIKKHIRRIRIEIPKHNKGDFDVAGGFENFRKRHFGKLNLTNDGINVDALYPELQGLFGEVWFPSDIDTLPDQLLRIAEVVDTPLSSVAEVGYDVDEAKEYTQHALYEEISEIVENSQSSQSTFHIDYRDTEGLSNRTILAEALDSIAQNDIEKNKLQQYKAKIALIESEQKKLNEIRAKAHEIRMTKGRTPTETKTMRDLDFEANQIANRISTYDKQLLNLESTAALKGVLEREKTKLRKRLEQKGKESLNAYKEKAAKTQRELITRYQESRAKAIEGRNKTEMRHKIKKVVSDLNKLLLNPTKEQHVPIGLQLVVAEALDAINMDTMNAEERVAYYNDLISKSSDPDEIEMLTKKRDFFEYRDANFKERITALKNAYAEFKRSEDPLIKNAHNEAIEDLIENTANAVGSKSLKDMSIAQLEAVYDMYKAVLATVRNSNKMFKEGRQATVTENSESVKVQVKEVGGHRERVLKLAKFFKKFGWNMLKPVTAMKVIGSKTFAELFDNVRAAEDTWAVDVNEAKEFYKGVSDKYGCHKWDFKTQHSFKDSRGEEFSISLDQMLSLYAYSKREQADEHLEFGGFIFDDAIEVTEKNKLGIPLKYEVNDANPHRLGTIQIMEIIGKLTKEQRAFVDEMQTYLSDVMGEKGNEVSLALYDIKLYKEKNYFPLKTARYFREFDPEKSGTPKIKNSGFSKKTVPQAGNPIVLSNFMDVWAGHVNDMSMYHAFVLPLEDFMRVYNYSSTAGGYDSVQQYIKNAYGSQANQYIEKLMDDLNGGARVDPSADVINKGISLFKKASVFASASVVVQQPSAIARAFAYINPKYFITTSGSALNLAKHKSVWAEVRKYAPVAVIKEMGYFDTGMGRSTVEWLKGNQTIKDKVDDALSKAPAIADELSWSYIWLAVKKEIQATTNLKVGSEEFLKKCGERFTEIITNTQVYDSVLSRSGMMRSKDTGMKMATAFMAEPTTTINMMADGIIQGKRGNKKFTAATVGAVSTSIILNSMLVALVYAARDDDEDETYAEKYIGSLTTELIDGFNPLTYIPFVKDMWSIAQGYDVERSDMSVVSDLWKTVEGVFNEDKSGWEKVSDVSGAVASLFGLPVKNIIRDAKGVYNLFETVLSDTPTTRAGIEDSVEDAVKSSIPLWDRLYESDTKSDKLYEAIMSGDQAHIERVKGRFDDETEIDAAIRKGLRENDSRIQEAAMATMSGNGDKRVTIQKKIISEGHFKQDYVIEATNAEIQYVRTKVKEAKEYSEKGKASEAEKIYNTLLNRGYSKEFLDKIMK